MWCSPHTSKLGSVWISLPASLLITFNLDGAPITSKSHTHTHPSHSQTSRLLTSSLSLGVLDQRQSQLHNFAMGFQKPGICSETRNLCRFLVSGIQWQNGAIGIFSHQKSSPTRGWVFVPTGLYFLLPVTY